MVLSKSRLRLCLDLSLILPSDKDQGRVQKHSHFGVSVERWATLSRKSGEHHTALSTEPLAN